MSYIIASFNVLKMGEYAVSQRLKDWRLIARIIKSKNADIVSLQGKRPLRYMVALIKEMRH